MKIIARRLRTLLLAAVLTVGAVWVSGCGGDDNPGGNNGNNIAVVDPSTVEKGKFADDRDGQVYNTVKIGKHTWMAENLNYTPSNADTWCYSSSPDSCAKYGRLYNWGTAWWVCPTGWKLPDTAAWNRLMKGVGGKNSLLGCVSGKCVVSWTGGNKLKSANGWNGTDDYGFMALPGGQRNSEGGFIGVGTYSAWWTVTEDPMGVGNPYYAFARTIYSDDDVADASMDKTMGYYVRCVKE